MTLPKTFWRAWWLDDMIDTNEVNTFTSTIQFQESEENEPPPKRFKHLNIVCDLLEQENKSIPVAPLSDGNKEIEKYLHRRHSAEECHWILWTIKDFTSSSFWNSVYSCLNRSSGTCFLSKWRSYKRKEKWLIRWQLWTRNFGMQKTKPICFKVHSNCHAYIDNVNIK